MQADGKRKFLVTDTSVLDGQQGFPIVQGYLGKDCPRVEVRTFGSFAFLSIGGNKDRAPWRDFAYPIPLEDALAMLECHCTSRQISKTRHLVPHGDEVLEVDVFKGKLAGLVIAELTPSLQSQTIELPAWIGPEVTGDPRFCDFALADMDGPPAVSPD